MLHLLKCSLSLFVSYLKGIEQCVVNNKSVFHKIKMGIPQGIILGPILFSLYIIELPDICPDIGLQMYADNIYISGKPVMLLQIS